MTVAKPDIGKVAQCGLQIGCRAASDAAVDMDYNRAAAFCPMACNLGRAVKRRVAEHDETDGSLRRRHAQFPLDISPRISS
jgi:hypothetical protein